MEVTAKRRSRRDPESGDQSVCHNTCPVYLSTARDSDHGFDYQCDCGQCFLPSCISRQAVYLVRHVKYIPSPKQAQNRHISCNLLL
jgi:hypothetical protein